MLQNNITEALRLFPPLIMLMRQVKRAFTVTTRTGHTYTIPKVLLLKPAQVLICEGPAMVKTVGGGGRFEATGGRSFDPKGDPPSLPARGQTCTISRVLRSRVAGARTEAGPHLGRPNSLLMLEHGKCREGRGCRASASVQRES